ncbi:DUF2603 domain-containing protein [Helicobacter baculiformis]|uniref:UPF0763 protein ACFOPX_05535 n=1 Tax=Helicobacter baculiformis TaxID=427351 RepID=A0ABV7ZIH5_9HELI|nr:DUF2603 domain-containing protein [Helicobacter baculiformis]
MDNTRKTKLHARDMQGIYQSLESGKNKVQAKRLAPNQMLLESQEGVLDTKEAWFVQDDQDQKFVVLPEVLLQYIVQVIQKAYEEKVMVELERDMAALTPIDFKDAMAVVFKKLEGMRGHDGSLPKISSLDFVKQIKRQHPNLFFNLPDFLESKHQEGFLDMDNLENIPF